MCKIQKHCTIVMQVMYSLIYPVAISGVLIDLSYLAIGAAEGTRGLNWEYVSLLDAALLFQHDVWVGGDIPSPPRLLTAHPAPQRFPSHLTALVPTPVPRAPFPAFTVLLGVQGFIRMP